MPHWAESILHDIRFAVRGWARSPAFVIAAIATLALGIGANTAIFSVVSAVLLRPLPFHRPAGLVQMHESHPNDRFRTDPYGLVIFSDLEEWRANSRLMERMVSYSTTGRNLQGMGDPELVLTTRSERGLFELLGVPPLAGRTFTESDPLNVAVASYEFWNTHFNADPSAIGRTLMLDGESFTLIGVMPARFQFPYGASSPALWIPWDLGALMRARPNGRLDAVVGRLKPGVSFEAAQQELGAMAATMASGRQPRLRPLKEVITASTRESLLVLLGAVGMVLLVACVNVANLLLARTASRDREIAVRAALGAGRARLVRQFLTESLLLAATGGAAGLAVGLWASRALIAAAGEQIPRAAEAGLDWRVFAFLLAVCAATGIAFGLAPALAAARAGDRSLRGRGNTSAPRDALVVAEVALAFVLLAGAGLLARTFLNLQRTNSGLRAENVLTVHVAVSGAPESIAIEQRVAQVPGVRAAGLISLLPLQESGWTAGFQINGQAGVHQTELRYVTPGYFRAMGVPLRLGREFTPSDGPQSQRVILVNEALARRHFPGENPVGRATDRGVIIGVVGDVRQKSLRDAAVPEIFYTVAQNFAQIRRHGSTLVVRAAGNPQALIPALRAAVREIIPGQALFRVATMQRVIDESLAMQRLYAWLLGVFAAIGTLLAIAGIYGVIAYLVALRTREFGIRMALGARAPQVLGLVMKRGGMLVGLGLLGGIAGALALTRVLEGVLYGVEPADPVTFAAMSILLAGAALAACLAPARRAAQVDPATALRCD